jgi:hypothetical protein
LRGLGFTIDSEGGDVPQDHQLVRCSRSVLAALANA